MTVRKFAAGLSVRLFVLLMAAVPALAQGTSPWHTAITNLQTAFTGPLARGLSLIAVVISGLSFAFGQPGAKRMVAGVIFGLAMTLGAVGWVNWLFP